jgi:hypothetical protein
LLSDGWLVCAAAMLNLGTYETDVDFAWEAASRLKHSFLRAASELEGQIPRRNAYATHAMRDWRGRYAKEFEREHMAVTARDAHRIAAECRRCAAMLEELAQLAREEQERRELARAWKVEHDAWKHEQADDNFLDDVGDFFGGDDEPKPPDLPEIKPHPHIAHAPGISARG